MREIRPESNPFLALRHVGVVLELEVEEPPRIGRASLRELVDTWSDATERY